MTVSKKILKTCSNGHQFYKSSDCPTCPICEKERKLKAAFFAVLGAPARRALESINISSLKDLSKYTEKEILQLHGMGKTSIPKLKEALQSEGLSFKNE